MTAAPPGLAQPVFVEAAESVGLDYRYIEPPVGGVAAGIEEFGGGAAAADYDGDGDIDLFAPVYDGPDHLFRNEGGRFVDVAEQVGLAYEGHSNGAVFVDIDRDGDLDLFVTTLNELAFRLYLQGVDGSFTEQALDRGASTYDGYAVMGFGVAVGDYDRDGYPDLFTTEWVRDATPCWGAHARLLHNQGVARPGYFEDVTARAGVVLPIEVGGRSTSFGAAFADMNDDGWPELLVTADFGDSRLFTNLANGLFRDDTERAGVGLDRNGMGSSIGDIDGDGDLDWFVSALVLPGVSDLGNRLFLNGSDLSFRDATDEFGVRDGDWGWGSAFFDYDNDGRVDLVHTSGSRLYAPDGPMRLFVHPAPGDDPVISGPMEQVAASAGMPQRAQGRGLLVADFDDDGDQDVFVPDNGGSARYYRNDSPAGAYLRVSPRDASGSPVVNGAIVDVWPAGSVPTASPIRRVHVGLASQFTGQSEPVAHLGLGASSADEVWRVRVRFPSGREAEVDTPANRTVIVTEPIAGAAVTPAALPAPPTCDTLVARCEPDCDGDGRPDRCNLEDGAADCNGNQVLDVCELRVGLASDCDENGTLDACQLTNASDCDGNGVLDRCEAPSSAGSADQGTPPPTDLDGRPAEADAGAAVTTPRASLSGCGAAAAILPSRVPWAALLLTVVACTRRRSAQRHHSRR